MAKAILISIKPRYVRDILNGDKTIEIRKTIPKCDLPVDVYIYVTKDKKEKLFRNLGTKKYLLIHCSDANGFNGKVIGKFTLKKTEQIHSYLEPEQWYMTNDTSGADLMKKSCLTFKELDDYLLSGWGYAWVIDKVKPFESAKPLNNYLVPSHQVSGIGFKGEKKTFTVLKPLTKAPQSWCFIEV